MKHFIGIDLGTTNSAICSFDGENTRIWKSPEQNDVTPSALYFDRRGNKFVGKRAYDAAPHSPENATLLFKRLMGTSTPIDIKALDRSLSPEECSSEVLKVLFGYLPEEIRNSEDIGTVITVPAAFNQMQKDATMQAAQMAGLGAVTLMQEPVAAVMSVMRHTKQDGLFLIYDLGGGTLDIAIAESINGRVNLLSHGGIAMCGGRDFDRTIFNNIVRPWLDDNFNLPENFATDPTYKSLIRLSNWATERAKIELSSNDHAIICLSESETRLKDLNDEDIYLDIPLERSTFNELIDDRINDSIEAARNTIKSAGLSPDDIERVVFIGGPTNYAPLREKVSFELGIRGGLEVNPMTAVAEGASIFAESIDWSSQNHTRKSIRGQLDVKSQIDLSFKYIARTPESFTKFAVSFKDNISDDYELQINCIDTGWSSGRMPLKNGTTCELPLSKDGDNNFKVFVYNEFGDALVLPEDKITITKTAVTVDAIPASYSIGIEVLNKLNGDSTLDFLVRAGDSLPVKGTRTFKAAQTLKAGSSDTINFKLWEGEIDNPVSDNRYIGVMKISGKDFDEGIIPVGAELECDFEMLDSGNIILDISVPSIGSTFNSGKNFYSRQEGMIDFSKDNQALEKDARQILERIEELEEVISDPKLDQAKSKVDFVLDQCIDANDSELAQEASEKLLEAKKLLNQVNKEHFKTIREDELERVTAQARKLLEESPQGSRADLIKLDQLHDKAQKAINHSNNSFETILQEIKSLMHKYMLNDFDFLKGYFAFLVKTNQDEFDDQIAFVVLVNQGIDAIESHDIGKLKVVIAALAKLTQSNSDEIPEDLANIIKG